MPLGLPSAAGRKPGIDLEYRSQRVSRPRASLDCDSVKIAVASLSHPFRIASLRAIEFGGGDEGSGGAECKDRARPVGCGPSAFVKAPQVTVRCLHQEGWSWAFGLGERGDRVEIAGGCELKDCGPGSAVKISVRALHQIAGDRLPFERGEAVDDAEIAIGSDAKDKSGVLLGCSGAVEISVGALDQRCDGALGRQIKRVNQAPDALRSDAEDSSEFGAVEVSIIAEN